MSSVNITNVQVLDNPAKWPAPLQFEITFECLTPLQEDLEWKVIYVGSAENVQHDQELESVMVGPVPVGVNKFVLQTEPPDHTKIPQSDLLGVTVVLLKCYYRSSEFLRVGFYVNNEYDNQEMQDNPPTPHDVERINRNILAAKPRITTFNNRWDNTTPEIEEVSVIDAEMHEGDGELLPEEEGDGELLPEEDEEEEEEEEDDEEEEELDGDEDGEDGKEGEEGEEDIKDENDVIEMDPQP